MKIIRTFVFLAILFFSISAWAAPFLISAPVAYQLAAGQTMTFQVTGLPGIIALAANSPADVAQALHLDLAGIPAGSYTVTAVACVNDPQFGQVCSTASAPFSFVVPGPPQPAASLGLSVK